MAQSWRSNLGSWLHLSASLGALFLADFVCRLMCRAAGVTFPSALLGMFILLATLLVVSGGSQPAADGLHAFFTPALGFIHHYMAMFYAPLLITLPQNAHTLIGPLLPRIIVLIVVGVGGSIFVTGQIITAIRKQTMKSEERDGHGSLPTTPTSARSLLGSRLNSGTDSFEGADPRPGSSSTAHLPPELVASLWGVVAMFAAAGVLASDVVVEQLFTQQLFQNVAMLAATVTAYTAGMAAPAMLRRHGLEKLNFVHPVLYCGIGTNVAGAVMGAISNTSHNAIMIEYTAPGGGGALLLKFLGVIILSFGFRLFEQRRLIAAHAPEVLGGVSLSVWFSLLSTAVGGKLLGLPPEVTRAVIPRSVTAALGLPIAESLGAPLPVTAAAIVCTGMVGAAMARPLLNWSGVTDPLARGISAAASAHGMATAALGTAEPDTLPFAALGYCLAGVFATALCQLAPVRQLLLAITS